MDTDIESNPNGIAGPFEASHQSAQARRIVNASESAVKHFIGEPFGPWGGFRRAHLLDVVDAIRRTRVRRRTASTRRPDPPPPRVAPPNPPVHHPSPANPPAYPAMRGRRHPAGRRAAERSQTPARAPPRHSRRRSPCDTNQPSLVGRPNDETPPALRRRRHRRPHHSNAGARPTLRSNLNRDPDGPGPKHPSTGPRRVRPRPHPPRSPTHLHPSTPRRPHPSHRRGSHRRAHRTGGGTTRPSVPHGIPR